MDKKLFKTREDIYKKCPSIFWEVSVFCLIFAIAAAAIAIVFSVFSIMTFALLFFPVLYATFMTLYSIKYGGTVTVKGTFNISLAYYRRNNFGCFRLLRCFGHAILVNVVSALVLYFLIKFAYEGIYGSAFTESYEKFSEIYASGNLEDMLNYLSEDNLYASFNTFVSSIALSLGMIAFVFGVTYNSPNVYLCSSIPGATAMFSTAVFKRFLKDNSNSYRKDFWSLNWPIFVLLPLGMTIGYVLVYALKLNSAYGVPISTMIGIASLIPFAPFFFAGMEALFAKYNPQMKQASSDLTQSFLSDLKNNSNISEEDRKKIEELLNKKMGNDENDVPLDYTTDNQNTNTNVDENDGGNDNEEK